MDIRPFKELSLPLAYNISVPTMQNHPVSIVIVKLLHC
jgi:hypothetical protein